MDLALKPDPAARTSVLGRVWQSTLSSGVGLAASLVSYLFISRFVSPMEYGRASIILSVWGFFTVSTEWCSPALMRFGPVELVRHKSLRVTLSTRLLFALPALIVLVPAAPLYLLYARDWSPSLAWGTAGFLVASAALGAAQWCSIAAQRFVPLACANAIARASPALLIVGALTVGQTVHAEALAFAAIAGLSIGALLLFVALAPLVGLARPDRALLAKMWRYCLPSLVSAPSLAIITYVDPLILQRSVSHADIGRYQLAYLTITLFSAAGGSVNGVLSPELVAARERGDGSAIDRYRRFTQPRLALELGLCACAAALVAAPLVRLLVPAVWAGAAQPVAILTVAGALLLALWSFHPLVTATDSVWSLQLATIGGAVTNVAFDLWLAPRFGVDGVALANVASWAVQLVVLALFLHRGIGARRVAILLIPCAAAVLGVLWLAPPWMHLPAGAVLLVAAAASRRRARRSRSATERRMQGATDGGAHPRADGG
jgi:O-antigen/teichoic acid export membrane protein